MSAREAKIDHFLYTQPGVSILTWHSIDLLSQEISLRAVASSGRTAAYFQEQKSQKRREGSWKTIASLAPLLMLANRANGISGL